MNVTYYVKSDVSPCGNKRIARAKEEIQLNLDIKPPLKQLILGVNNIL